jgi:hypothetical protein
MLHSLNSEENKNQPEGLIPTDRPGVYEYPEGDGPLNNVFTRQMSPQEFEKHESDWNRFLDRQAKRNQISANQ